MLSALPKAPQYGLGPWCHRFCLRSRSESYRFFREQPVISWPEYVFLTRGRWQQ